MKIFITLILGAALCLVAVQISLAQIQVNTAVDGNQIAEEIVGAGVTISNINLNCATGAYGIFENGSSTNIGLNNGVVLTTGSATDITGPNNASNTTTSTFFPGDADLNSLIPGFSTFDACVLEFDFVAENSQIEVTYVFGSEEYPEFVCSSFNDVFGFFITGPDPAGGNYNAQNLAVLPGTDIVVSINNVNGRTDGSLCASQTQETTEFFVDNDGGSTIEYDGFTVTLTATADIIVGETYSFKFAIADAGDRILDSGVLLSAESFTSEVCDGGQITDQFGNTEINFTVGDGIADEVILNTTSTQPGAGYLYVLADESDQILDFQSSNNFDFDNLPAGNYTIRGINWFGEISGLVVENNISDISSSSCFEFSNMYTVIAVPGDAATTCATWDGTQWINGVEPDATLCAVIESGTLMTDKGYTSLSLEVKPGARLVVTSGNFWDVKEDVIVDATGELTVESGGTFLTYDGFTFDGEMNYIRNTSFTDGRYSVMSTPVQTATISDIGGFAYRFDEPSGTYQNYSGAMEVGAGYFAYCNNTVSFQGMPNVGDYSLTLPSDNSGFNVVGNPYTAAIDADAFLDANANNIMSTIWLWNNNGSKGYLTYNELGTVGGNTDGTDFDGAIGAAQGFYVMVNQGADVLFTESMRLTDRNQDNTYLRELSAKKKIDKHTLKLALTGNETSDETLIGFTEEATEGWDERFDAIKVLTSPFNNESRLSVFSQLDKEPMAIQGLAKLNKVFNTVVVDLGADIPVRGNYTLSIDEMDLPEWASVLLEDTETGTLHDLVKKGYEFEASQGMEKNRFKLWIGEVEEGNHLAEIRMHGKSNMLTIWPSASGDEAEINIYNLQGQQVNAGTLSQDSQKFDMRVPGAGIYVVSMKSAEGMHVQKVMVQP